ncbi:unnamed protein product, partial [marine sediment metagenome]
SLCSHSISFYDVERQIEEIKKGSEKFGSSIYWYIVYDPDCPMKSIKILDDYRDKINFAGVKIHPVIHNTRLDNKGYFPLWEYATGNGIVVVSHTWSPYTDNPKQYLSNPLLLESVLDNFGDLKIVLGHAGGKVPFYKEVIDFIKKYKNVYLDFSGDTFYPPIFRKVIDEVGQGRALFGTDMPMMDTRYHIINVLLADLNDGERKSIFYNNTKKLFKIG